jgi:hypothetical protein
MRLCARLLVCRLTGLPVPKGKQVDFGSKVSPASVLLATPPNFSLYAVVEPNQIGRIGMAAFDNYTHSWLGLTLAPMRPL